MPNRNSVEAPSSRLEREVARERHERALHDEARAHLAADDDFRIKDARERTDTSNFNRYPER